MWLLFVCFCFYKSFWTEGILIEKMQWCLNIQWIKRTGKEYCRSLWVNCIFTNPEDFETKPYFIYEYLLYCWQRLMIYTFTYEIASYCVTWDMGKLTENFIHMFNVFWSTQSPYFTFQFLSYTLQIFSLSFKLTEFI